MLLYNISRGTNIGFCCFSSNQMEYWCQTMVVLQTLSSFCTTGVSLMLQKKEIKQKLQTKKPQTNKQKVSFLQKSKNRLQPIPTNYTCWKPGFLKMLKKITLPRANSITLWRMMGKPRFRRAVLWISPKWSVSHPYLLHFMIWLNSLNISNST